MSKFIVEYIKNISYIEEYVFKQSLNIDKNIVELSINVEAVYFWITPKFSIYMIGKGNRSESIKYSAEEFLITHPLLMLYVYHAFHENRCNLRIITDALQRMRVHFK